MIDFPKLLSKFLRRTFWLFTYFFSKIGKYVNKSLKKYIFSRRSETLPSQNILEEYMETNTVKLLRECNAGIKMGMNALNLVLGHVKDSRLKVALEEARDTHAILGDETHKMLIRARQSTKDAHPMAEAMSDMKIKASLAMDNSKSRIAHLITDGCNMGAKSISHYLNKYPDATDPAKNLANRIIAAEDTLRDQLRTYL